MSDLFFFYLLSVWGLTHIVVSSKILENFRNWIIIKSQFFGDLLNCYQCFSFWASIALYFVFPQLGELSPRFYIRDFILHLDPLLYGFIGSGLISFLSVLLSLIIKKSK